MAKFKRQQMDETGEQAVDESKTDPATDPVETPTQAVDDVAKFLLDFQDGETVAVNRKGLYDLYNRMLRNKAQFYCGPGARRLLFELLNVEGPKADALHSHIAHGA